MSNNSSGVKIYKINENVTISDKFGELSIDGFNSNFGEFLLNLSQSNAIINLGDVSSKFKYQVNKVNLENKRAGISNTHSSTKNLIIFKGDYSSILIK